MARGYSFFIFFSIYSENHGVQAEPFNFARLSDITYVPSYYLGIFAGVKGPAKEQTLDNLCGDLNKGYLPLNPIGQNVGGVSYPFDLMKTKALEYFSKALPILKADDTLPKVAKYENNHISYHPTLFNSKPST